MRDEKKEAKVDRRVIFTKASIKDALLDEIKTNSFEDIGIVGLCEKAQISRSAFYLHFANIQDVLEEVVTDAIKAHCGIIGIILGGNVDLDCEMQETGDQIKYVGLFSDKTAADMLMKHLVNNYKNEYVKKVSAEYGLSKGDAEFLFYFQTAGIISAATESDSSSLKRWNRLGQLRDKMLNAGVKGLKGRSQI